MDPRPSCCGLVKTEISTWDTYTHKTCAGLPWRCRFLRNCRNLRLRWRCPRLHRHSRNSCCGLEWKTCFPDLQKAAAQIVCKGSAQIGEARLRCANSYAWRRLFEPALQDGRIVLPNTLGPGDFELQWQPIQGSEFTVVDAPDAHFVALSEVSDEFELLKASPNHATSRSLG